MVEINLELERKKILQEYRALLKNCKKRLNAGDKKLIREAFEMAVAAHSGVRRKSGEPYILHPLAVANICACEIGLGTTSIVCALLHDVVEDTEITLEDIQEKFGESVASIIDGLTKVSGLVGKTDSTQSENFRKIVLTMSKDVRVILIKLADRLHNMRTLDSMSRTGQLKIASETISLFAPIAHRLGLYSIKSELEDLSLKYTDPHVYKEISQKLLDTKAVRNKFIKQFTEPLEEALNSKGIDYEIKGRPKSIYSIHNKMKKQGISFDEVYDLFAVRVIVESPIEVEIMDCWAVYTIVTKIYTPNPSRLRDWISVPKSNGYEALHTTVMSKEGKYVEVQIRSRRMDGIAERGLAAHYKYKEGISDKETALEKEDKNIDLWLSQIRESLENSDSNALDFVNDFRANFFTEEIVAFSPKGDLIKLPYNSTVMDFAFMIHSEVGKRMIGAKVNRKMVPKNQTLQNGDQVEILTAKSAVVEEEWLQYVNTAKAKARIKDLLKEEKRQFVEAGKKELEKLISAFNLKFNPEVTQWMSAYFKLENIQELFFRVGKGIIPKSEIIKGFEFIETAESLDKGKSNLISPDLEHQISYGLPDTPDLVAFDKGIQLPYLFARCCNPIPGDEIVGILNIGNIKIHRTSCPNAIKFGYVHGDRLIKSFWKSHDSKLLTTFPAGLQMVGIDGLGIVSQITDIISKELKMNMQSLSISSLAGTFEGKIVLFIYDLKHLEDLIIKLKSIDGIERVERFDVEKEI